MKYFALALMLLAFLNGVISVLQAIIALQLERIKERLNKIIMNQAEFDEQIRLANEALAGVGTSLTDIATAIQTETQEIIDFINSLPPEVDTSALTGVVANLQTANESLSTANESVSGIFTAPE